MHSRGRRWMATGLAAIVAGGFSLQALTASAADEDELRERKGQVGGQLEEAHDELGHSSKQLVAAMERLEAAEGKLRDAEAHLSQTRTLLEAAAERDRRMQARLEEAKQRLAAARAKLAVGERQVRVQRDELAGYAAQSFQSTDNRFMRMRMFLEAEDPESLTAQMGAAESVADTHAVSYDHLKASEVLLRVNEEEVQAAKVEVAEQRAAAARNLDRKQALEAEAQAAEQAVSDLVAARADARRDAEAAKQEDLRQVEALEAERSRIEAELREIAERRAAALARARAEAAAERRAAERAEAAERAQVAQEQASRSAPSAPSAPAPAPPPAPAPVASGLIYPVDSYITSPYGMRLHPILGVYKLHDGTDFGAGCGTPVRAAASGTVLEASYDSAYGNRVIIDHGIESGVSLSSSYNHLDSFGASSGTSVQQGEVIGYVGTTGYSTGCHLHFMVYENGGTVDPMSWL